MITEFHLYLDIIMTVLETILLWYIFREKKSSSTNLKKFLFFSGFLGTTIILTLLNLSIPLKLIFLASYVTLLGYSVYDEKIISIAFTFLLYIAINLANELIVTNLWYLISNKPITVNIERYEFYVSEIYIITAGLKLSSFVLIDKIFISKNDIKGWKDLSPYLVTTITLTSVSFCFYLVMPRIESTKYIVVFLISSFLILISLICNILFLNNYLKLKQEEQLEEALKYELKLKCDYYQQKFKDEEKLKKIYHDMKNHLLILEENEKDNGHNYMIIQNLKDEIARHENYYNTGNEILDIILREKIKIAQELKIEVKLNIDYKSTDFMEPLDVSSIFGNLFDNAIEACKKIKNADKYIALKVKIVNTLWILSIRNSIPTASDPINVKQTSKRDKQMHGLGVKSVQDSVKKYGGRCNIEQENNEFIFHILIAHI